ncbi:HNH endonuclease [Streptomyces sp. NPDC058049]|uniref:HNH endonuclease n=1 Tax=Streptomyces sp. NPDC058049 TaxID=3346314 RepID=UPI0036EDDD7B
MRCIDCTEPATHRGRCHGHQVDVDHVRPQSLGGEDTDSNVQVLCHDCHRLKTREDFGVTGAPFRRHRSVGLTSRRRSAMTVPSVGFGYAATDLRRSHSR